MRVNSIRPQSPYSHLCFEKLGKLLLWEPKEVYLLFWNQKYYKETKLEMKQTWHWETGAVTGDKAWIISSSQRAPHNWSVNMARLAGNPKHITLVIIYSSTPCVTTSYFIKARGVVMLGLAQHEPTVGGNLVLMKPTRTLSSTISTWP